ncbi:MAG: hypothetical protein ACQEW8_07410 [Actinomycetota bacterium]
MRATTEPEQLRVGEIMTPALGLARALVDVSVGAVVGTVLTFLGILVLGIAGEEALSAFYSSLDLDPLFRATMGVILVMGLVVGFLLPTTLIIEKFAARAAVREQSDLRPEIVPNARVEHLLEPSPGPLIRGTGLALIILGGTAAGICLLLLLTDGGFADDIETWVGILGGAGIIGVGVLLRNRGAAVITSAKTSGHPGSAHRTKQRAIAVRNEKRRRMDAPRDTLPRIVRTPSAAAMRGVTRVMTVVVTVAAGAFFLSIFLRQQCRTCDPITWDAPMEDGIDALSLLSSGALVLSGVIAVLLWIGGWVLQTVRERALAAWAATGVPRRVAVDDVRPFLAEPRAASRFARACGALGAAMLTVAIGIEWSGWQDADPMIALVPGGAAIMLGVLTSFGDSERERRERQALRDVTFPGDPTVEKASTARRGTPDA